MLDVARQHLRGLLGPDADFRPGQWDAVEQLVVRRRRVLVVQRTGWGKSVVYFVATRLLRDAGSGPTLLVSPLLSLMRDQVRAATRIGVRAATIHSGNRDEWDAVEAALKANECDLLLVSPERLANEHFRSGVLAAAGGRLGLLAVDEAHCVSDWGHDFRPDYRRIRRVIDGLPAGVPVLATTATANDRVVADVREQFGGDLLVVRGPLVRESLRLQAIRLGDAAERLAWLAQHLPSAAHSRLRHRLRFDATGLRARGDVADEPGHPGRRVPRRHGRAAPRGTRAGPARQPRPRAGRHGRPRDGLRQGRLGVRRPLPEAGVGGGVLPTGRPGGTRRAPRLRHPARRRRGRRDPRLLRQHRLPEGAIVRGDSRSAGQRREPVRDGTDRERQRRPDGTGNGPASARNRRGRRPRHVEQVEALLPHAEPVAAGRGPRRAQSRRCGGPNCSRCATTSSTAAA